MGKAKEIRVGVITSKEARAFVRAFHYSGTAVANSTLHLGAFYKGKLHGVMQFGSPLDKSKVLNLVDGTGWSEMIELNRMAFDDVLPKNSESRCLAIAFKLIKKNAPHVKWVLSFSDATQSGDGTIYRASGFHLTKIHENTSILIHPPTGKIYNKVTFNAHKPNEQDLYKACVPLKGYQLRYIKLLYPNLKLNCEIIPYSRIKELGAGMYLGKKRV